VKVVNADTAQSSQYPDLRRVHGIALVPVLVADSSATVALTKLWFDVKSLKVTGHIKTGGNPDCILYDPASKHIFTMNGKVTTLL